MATTIGRLRACHVGPPLTAALVAFAGYALISVVLAARFGTSYDAAIFLQGLSSVADGNGAFSAIKGGSIFGDHLHPIVLVAAPLLWVHDGISTLLLLQGAALGLAVGVVVDTCQRLGVSWRLPAVWMVSPGIMSAATFDFHELTLGAPLLALACRALLLSRYQAAFWWSLSLLLVKEDIGALVMGLGVAFALKRRWWPAVCLVLIGPIHLWLATRVIIPALNPGNGYTYASDPSVQAGPFAALGQNLVWPGYLTWTIVGSALLFGWRVVRSPVIWPALGWWGAHALVSNPRYQLPWYHYQVLPTVALAFAGIQVLASKPDAGRSRSSIMIERAQLAGCLAAALLGPATVRLGLTLPNRPEAAQAAIANVPAGAVVAADPKVAAALVPQRTVLLLRPPPSGSLPFSGLPLHQANRPRTCCSTDAPVSFRAQPGSMPCSPPTSETATCGSRIIGAIRCGGSGELNEPVERRRRTHCRRHQGLIGVVVAPQIDWRALG